MDYTIISISDIRDQNKNDIRSKLTYNEVFVECVNGHDIRQLLAAKAKWSEVPLPGFYQGAEYGIFFSLLNCWEYGANNNGILYFEDDAIIAPNFQQRFDNYVQELNNPELFVIWNAPNQAYDYSQVSGYDDVGVPIYHEQVNRASIFDIGSVDLCKAYNGYGNVAMYWSRAGCEKILDVIHEKGMWSTPDCLIYIAAHMNLIEAYSLKPTTKPLVTHDFNWPSTRAGSTIMNLGEM